MRSPVTELLEKFESLNEVEQKVFLDLVAPEPEAPKVKQTRKKRSGSPAQKRGLPSVESSATCFAQVPGLDVLCGEPEDRLIHDPKGGYASYHPFVAVAPPAAKKSSRKNGSAKDKQLPTQSSEIPLAVVGDVAQAASGGD